MVYTRCVNPPRQQEAGVSVGMRKTEYVVRSSSAPAALDSLRTRFERRRRRQAVGRPWYARGREWTTQLDALPWNQVRALPWRAIGAGILGGFVLLLVTSALIFHVAYAERVQPGVYALGLDLGGKTMPEAQDLVAARITAFSREPLTLYFDNREWRTTVAELGIRLDAAPIVAAAYAAGRDGNPLDRLTRPVRSLFGAREVPQPEVTLDAPRVDAYLATIAATVDRPMASARLAISPAGRVDYSFAETERRTDLPGTRERLRSALLVGESLWVPLAVSERNPPITDADLGAAREQAERHLAGPVVLELSGDSWRLEPAEIASLIELVGTPERPTGVKLKDAALEQAVRRIVGTIEKSASNARFEFVGGELRPIRESRDGREVDLAATLSAVRQAIASTERTVEVPAKVTAPAVTTAQRSQLGIQDLIERGETRFAGSSPPKIHNIKLAAARLHGVVVPPGAMFSFNRELGPTTLDSGYQVGWGIAAIGDGGHATVPSVAGGICQVATTLLHPVFWAGYQIEERHNHLYWIPSYTSRNMVGLDATVDEDSGLDFRFVNSSPDYLLIQTATDDSAVAISLYGTKPQWTVKVEGPTITNWKTASRDLVRWPEPSLPWGQSQQVESAGNGFDVAITRSVSDGGSVRPLNLRTHYEPSQNLIVVGVRGAPAGTAEDIRASNRQRPNAAVGAAASSGAAASGSAATATLSPTLGTTAGVPTSGPQAAPAVAPAAAAPAPTAPATSAATSSAPSASGGSSASTTAPSGPVGGAAGPAPPSAGSAAPPATGPAAPVAPPPSAPNAPRFGNSPSR
jgi:vancomycin resistance protein YoaR